jgi:nucleoside-diphosphate-sugar epimerase
MSAENNPINIGNPEEIPVLEIAKEIIRLSKSNSKIVFKELPVDDPKVRQPDITKATKELGWKPVVKREDGLKDTIEYFKNLIVN